MTAARGSRAPVLLGIAVHTDVAALHDTLDALAPALRLDDRLLVMADGPDPAVDAALTTDARVATLDVVSWTEPQGNPVAFNALLARRRGDEAALVFLENGARPAPDAIDRLVTALAAPDVGLAGPSTNDAWNEQGAPMAPGVVELDGVADATRELQVNGHRSLAPLHSLAEVCIAVSPRTIDAVGAADQGFGLGPCWEMEYAARAARAGLPAVWVPAAYVHRAPPTTRRLREEPRRFAASRRRYQDRVCGLRLTGARPGYDQHCIGDACPDFAPAAHIAVHLPLAPPSAARTTPPGASPGASPASHGAQGAPSIGPAGPGPERGRGPGAGPVPAPAPARIGERRPAPVPTRDVERGRAARASCIMPTADRPAWAARAIAAFHAQDHDDRELIVVDDGDLDLRTELGHLLDHPAIVHLRLPGRSSIGAKRNLGVARSTGEMIVHWDDDDWHGPGRLSRQVAPLRTAEADITGLRDAIWFDVPGWRFRRPTPDHHAHLFVEDVHGGTLAYHRSVWETGVRYPDVSLAEDAWFLRNAVRRGARLARLPAAGVFLYVRHGTNSWQVASSPAAPGGWDDVPEPPELARDRAFYAARSPAAPVSPPVWRPRVSCTMPTADRHGFVPAAVAGALAQRSVDVELVVVDDGHVPVADLLPDDRRITYVRLDGRTSLGEKRNLAAEAARGEVLVHVDDDDWSHPDRVRIQLDALDRSGADVCGASQLLWWDPVRSRAWRYSSPPLHRPWVAGNTLAYRRATWAEGGFPAQAVGEDTAFVWGRPTRRVEVISDERLVIGRIHDGNTSAKDPTGSAWAPIDPALIHLVMDEAGGPVPWVV